MNNCFNTIQHNLQTVIEQSGHFFFNYGQYQSCLQTQGFNYSLVKLGYGQSYAGIFIGLCLPKQCTNSIISDGITLVLSILQYPFNIYSINSNVQNYDFPITWVYYLTCIILSVFAFTAIISTIIGKKIALLRGFSLQESLSLIKSNKQSDLNVFNGIRSLAMMWVVFGHYFLNSSSGVVNTINIADVFKQPFMLFTQSALLAVDIFFFLGGFFLAFVFMREKHQSLLKYPLAILHRLLRIWPVYILAMMIYYSVFMRLGQGPKWQSNEAAVLICKDMWKSIFFIQNIVDNGQKICLGWGWYLQTDFQLFIVCLILLFIYSKSKQISYLITLGILAFSFYLNISYTQKHQMKIFTDQQALIKFQGYFFDIYIKPYTRCSPYFIGLYAGIFYSEFKYFQKNNHLLKSGIIKAIYRLKLIMEQKRYIRWIIEWLGIGIMGLIVLTPRDLQLGNEWPQWLHSLYFCFGRPVFVIAILLTTLPSLLGFKHSFFSLILNTEIFSIIGKISFCTYLLHMVAMYQFISTRAYDVYFSFQSGFIVFVGCLVLALAVGFLFSVFVQLPCSYYQRELMKMFQGKVGKQQIVRQIKVPLSESSMKGLAINYTVTNAQNSQ